MRLIQKMIIIPVVTGIILCAVLFFALKSTDAYLPIKQETIFAYHNSQPEKAENAKSVKENSIVGTVEFSDKEFSVVFENDYSNMINSFSMLKNGSTPDEYGCVYLKTILSNANAVKKSKELQLKTVYGDFKYKFVKKINKKSEFDVLSYFPRAKKSLVIFYQKNNDIGLSSDYEALVFEEVQM